VSNSGQAGITHPTVDGQGQYARQLHNVATVYNVYRIVLPLVLLLTYVSTYSAPALGIINSRLFVQIASGYVFLGLVIIVLINVKSSLALEKRFLTAVFLLDILIFSFLAYLSGGVVSGLTLLLIVNIAFANMLLQGRIGIFFAAVAALAVIYCEAYLTLTYTDYPGQFIQSGILGIILFATAFYIQSASRRAMAAAQLAEEQATSIVDLEKLNNEIIQRMRTGIMVVNASDEVVTLNNAAHSLLGPILESETLEGKTYYRLPSQLQQQINSWRKNPLHRGDLIKVPGPNVSLQTNFAYLNDETNSDILVFIENQSRIMQRIRQTKLASLGRLTANIAHEIRNPLGAISHAGQMLQESDHLSGDEERMLEIILNQSNRMNRIIEEVLDVSRHKDVAPSLIDLGSWMNEFIQQYKDSSSECDEIDFEYQGNPVQLRIITSQLERVFTNLFDNGLRYSKKATGQATLTVVAGMKPGVGERTHPFVSVIDRGPALDDEAESRLFEPFHTTESSGTGLGLYISKELCEANQATLDYSTSDDGTSCFTVNFSNSLPSQPEQSVNNE